MRAFAERALLNGPVLSYLNRYGIRRYAVVELQVSNFVQIR
jgi:hypothetical protein